MKKGWIILVVLVTATACDEEKSIQEEEPTIIRNLPTQDRDFLLEPLEAALDDLRNLAEDNPNVSEETYRVDTAGWQGKRTVGTLDGDTVRVYLDIQRSGQREQHWRYWDNDGELYYLETWIQHLDDQGGVLNQMAYKLYLEEGGRLISSYERRAFDGEDMIGDWRAASFTPEEMNYILRAGKR